MTIRRILSSLSPYTWGLLVLAAVYATEYYTGVSASVAYLLSVLLILWFSWRNPHITWIGILPTALIIVGFFMIHNNMDIAIAINRLLAVITIWIAIFFVNRYRKAVEEEEIQKRQLEALFENATEGMIFSDAHGQIVRSNAAAEGIFGYERGELVGKKIEVLIPERFAQKHVGERDDLFRNPTKRPKGVGRELTATRKNGEEFPAEISLSFFKEHGNVFYIAFIVDISERKKHQRTIEENMESIKRLNSDLDLKVKMRTSELEAALHQLESTNDELVGEITGRKKIEQRLLKSQQLYSAVARNFPGGIIGVLDRNLRYVLVDGQELKALGFLSGQPMGERVFAGSPRLMAYAEPMIGKSFDGESVSFDVELDQNIYNVIAVPLPDASGIVNEVLIVLKNITTLKLAERKLVKAVAKEKELGALKSRFVTMASHEFRTPLSTMLSSVFLLENYTGDKYEAQKKTHLERIRRSIQTLTELMNDFLSIGRLEEGEIKVVYRPVDLNSFLRETIAELNGIKKSGQRLELSFPDVETSLVSDRQMFTNILRNLVSNAVKYSPPDGTIRIVCKVSDAELELSVQDEGIGIPEHEQGEIFKRFYRAENATNIQGTGLGLNIVRKYVKLLNGSIGFASKLNAGTTFTLRLPLQPQQQIQETY